MPSRPEDAGPGRPPGARRLDGWLGSRAGRRAVLAVWLATMIVLSLFFVPGVGAAPPDGGPSVDAPGRNGGPGQGGGSDGAGPADREQPGAAGDGGGNADSGPPAQSGNGGGSGDHDTADATEGGPWATGDRAGTGPDREPTEESTDPSDVPTGPTAEPSEPSDEPNGTTVTADGVEAGETVTMDVSDTQSGDVKVDSVSGTSTESGDVTLTVGSEDDSTTESTEFESDDGAEEVGRFSLTSASGDQSLDDVSVTFEVSKQRLDAMRADLESIGLYARVDGEWVALETEAVGETTTHYVFTADSPYLSSFAVGALRPAYELWSATVDSRRVTAGESVTASARFTNVGSADGVFVVELVVDGRTVDRQQLTVAGGGTRQATFRWTPDRPGTYELVVNGVPAGTVTVTPADDPDDGATVLAQLTGWLADLGPASLLEWADRNGRSAVIGPVPSAVATLTG